MKELHSFLRRAGNFIVYRTPAIWPDILYLKLRYFFKCGCTLKLDNPQTYNEKLQWLKIHDQHDEYTIMVDKYLAKSFVKERIGGEYVIPTLGVWNKFSEIDFSILPNQFVLKTTHDSGGVVIVKDKSSLNMKIAEQVLTKSLHHNYYLANREYPYKRVPPRIIAENYLIDESGVELKDYKVFCFNGVPRAIQVDYDRFVGHKRNMYDTEWNRLPFTLEYPTDWNIEIAKPVNLSKMLDISAKLSKGIPHVRVDLYNVSGHIYFGELTFFHGGGYESFTPECWNKIFGDWIDLPSNP